MIKRYLFAGVFMLFLVLPMVSMAENRALLVGVGDYEGTEHDLQGIDIDIRMMQEVASLMGFQKNQIEILEDSAATYLNVKKAIKTGLIDNVTAGDEVFIYFSSHGSYIADDNGDENDGRDEVVVLYDTRVVTDVNGNATLENSIRDDELGQLLSQIRSKNVLVIMDCCHSGTNTRAINLRSRTVPVTQVQEKFFSYPGMNRKSEYVSYETKGAGEESGLNFVSLAACRDSEQSVASPHGSYFTLGIRNALRQAAAKNQNVTPMALTEAAAAFVDSEITIPSRRFHPQITGNETLKTRRLALVKMNSGYGPVWQDLIKLTERATDQVPIQINKSCYELDDALVMKFQIPKAGYLNVISVGADDEPTVLFPNKLHPDTVEIPGGSVQIPTDKMDFELTAMDAGPVLIVAFLTSKPVNLYAEGFKAKDQMFASLSPRASYRNFGVAEKKADFFYAGKRITKIVTHGNCR